VSIAPTAIAFTAYPVTDMTRSVAFYGETLGLPQVGHAMEYWTEFEVGGMTFGVGTFEQIGKAGTAQSLALEVPDIAAYRERLKAAGFESTEPTETPVCFISMVTDPDGNKIIVHQAKPH